VRTIGGVVLGEEARHEVRDFRLIQAPGRVFHVDIHILGQPARQVVGRRVVLVGHHEVGGTLARLDRGKGLVEDVAIAALVGRFDGDAPGVLGIEVRHNRVHQFFTSAGMVVPPDDFLTAGIDTGQRAIGGGGGTKIKSLSEVSGALRVDHEHRRGQGHDQNENTEFPHLIVSPCTQAVLIFEGVAPQQLIIVPQISKIRGKARFKFRLWGFKT